MGYLSFFTFPMLAVLTTIKHAVYLHPSHGTTPPTRTASTALRSEGSQGTASFPRDSAERQGNQGTSRMAPDELEP